MKFGGRLFLVLIWASHAAGFHTLVPQHVRVNKSPLVGGWSSSSPYSSTTQLTTAAFPMMDDSVSSKAVGNLRETFRSLRHNLSSNSVWNWRMVFGSFFSSLVLFRHVWDAQLVHFWNYLLTSSSLPARIFRTDSWEWCWAISCFAVYIHAFGWADRKVRKADEKGLIHPWKKYRLQDRYEADKHHRNVLKAAKGSTDVQQQPGEINDDPGAMPVKQSKWHWKAWAFEFWIYAAPLMVWDILAPRRHRRIGGFAPPTTMGILGGIVGGLLLYDLLFFCGHYLMHKVPFLYKTIHSKHHITKEVRACDIVRLSLGEEVLEVGFSIIALNLLGVHPVARTIYNAVITFLLTELHCGFDFPWQPQNVIPFDFATGSRRHHYHHRIGKHYYQKFFFHVDRLFGFFQKDDGSLDGDSVKKEAYVPNSWTQAPQPAS